LPRHGDKRGDQGQQGDHALELGALALRHAPGHRADEGSGLLEQVELSLVALGRQRQPDDAAVEPVRRALQQALSS
jgi:hypothetical protein